MLSPGQIRVFHRFCHLKLRNSSIYGKYWELSEILACGNLFKILLWLLQLSLKISCCLNRIRFTSRISAIRSVILKGKGRYRLSLSDIKTLLTFNGKTSITSPINTSCSYQQLVRLQSTRWWDHMRYQLAYHVPTHPEMIYWYYKPALLSRLLRKVALISSTAVNISAFLYNSAFYSLWNNNELIKFLSTKKLRVCMQEKWQW